VCLKTDPRSYNTPSTCGFNQDVVNHCGDKIENTDSLETSAVELTVCLYRADLPCVCTEQIFRLSVQSRSSAYLYRADLPRVCTEQIFRLSVQSRSSACLYRADLPRVCTEQISRVSVQSRSSSEIVFFLYKSLCSIVTSKINWVL
jgi:hypothetical protein